MSEIAPKEAKVILHCPFEPTDAENEELRQAFNLFDTDGAGTIKSEEVRVALTALQFNPTYEEIQELIAKHDTEKAGQLSFDEFTAIVLDKISELRPTEDLIRAFDALDNDQDGYLSLDDLQEASDFLGTDLSKDELREIIMSARGLSNEFDIHTKDVGKISQSQFINAVKRNYH